MYITLFGQSINWVAQVLDLVGAFILLFAYIQSKKLKFLSISIFAYFFFAAESVVITFSAPDSPRYADIIISSVAAIRNVIMIFYLKKKNTEMPLWFALVLLGLTWAANIPFFIPGLFIEELKWYFFMPCVFLTIFNLAAIQKNFYILKIAAILLEGSYILYNFITGAYIGAIREIVIVISIIISIISMIIKEKKEKTLLEQKQNNSPNKDI